MPAAASKINGEQLTAQLFKSKALQGEVWEKNVAKLYIYIWAINK